MLLPSSCPVCGAIGAAPCLPCRSQMERAPALARPSGVDKAAALLQYSGAGRELVARLKYRNARSSIGFLASGMAALVADDIDVVTWIPTTVDRRRQRGFDQAELLARAVARRLGRPCRPLLRRLPGPAQTGKALAERRRGPAFGVRRRPPARVLLVDDVITTGATATAAARTLRQAGVRTVRLVAAARTPPRATAGTPSRAGVLAAARTPPRAGSPAGARTRGSTGGVHSAMAVRGSVVESRGQPQAKRPT